MFTPSTLSARKQDTPRTRARRRGDKTPSRSPLSPPKRGALQEGLPSSPLLVPLPPLMLKRTGKRGTTRGLAPLPPSYTPTRMGRARYAPLLFSLLPPLNAQQDTMRMPW